MRTVDLEQWNVLRLLYTIFIELFIWFLITCKISTIQIKTYLMNTHGKTHSGYTVDIVQIFKVFRHGETERFEKVRIYLHNPKWQYCQMTNFQSIHAVC
jgi:ABC-type transport system involved in Fe-S cluster assembly fused permease/ATPase subunit